MIRFNDKVLFETDVQIIEGPAGHAIIGDVKATLVPEPPRLGRIPQLLWVRTRLRGASNAELTERLAKLTRRLADPPTEGTLTTDDGRVWNNAALVRVEPLGPPDSGRVRSQRVELTFLRTGPSDDTEPETKVEP